MNTKLPIITALGFSCLLLLISCDGQRMVEVDAADPPIEIHSVVVEQSVVGKVDLLVTMRNRCDSDVRIGRHSLLSGLSRAFVSAGYEVSAPSVVLRPLPADRNPFVIASGQIGTFMFSFYPGVSVYEQNNSGKELVGGEMIDAAMDRVYVQVEAAIVGGEFVTYNIPAAIRKPFSVR